jgi:hypothetical protein
MMVRLYSGEDWQSHFEEIELPTGPEGRALMEAVTWISFNSHEVGWSLEWHNAPRRQYVIVLGDAVEYGVGDGTLVRFGPGDILLAEDMRRAMDTRPGTCAAYPGCPLQYLWPDLRSGLSHPPSDMEPIQAITPMLSCSVSVNYPTA